MDADSLKVQPGLLIEPANHLLLVVYTTTGLEEHVDVSIGKLSILNQDLEAHHELKHDLVLLEDTSVDVSVDLAGQLMSNICYTILG